MKRLKTQELSKLSHDDLVNRLNDLRSELSTLRSKAARGTLKKELGEIKTVRRNIARVMTAMNAEHAEAPKAEESDEDASSGPKKEKGES